MYAGPITADWTGSPAARRLLASFVGHPPRIVTIPHNQRWTARATTYVGYRVECLTHLLGAYQEPIRAEAERTDDWSVWDVIREQPSVEEAIDDVLGMGALVAGTDTHRADILAALNGALAEAAAPYDALLAKAMAS